MEIVYQETNDGERQLELWENGTKVCTCVDVADTRQIKGIVNAVNIVMDSLDEISKRIWKFNNQETGGAQ